LERSASGEWRKEAYHVPVFYYVIRFRMNAVDDDNARNVVREFKLMDHVMDGLFSVEGHEV